MEFIPFKKIARMNRDCIITEKIDGTNASIHIGEDGEFKVGSRTRFITPENDNYGFARWAYENKDELMKLGEGSHYGEWWGQGIQRKYGMDKKVFSLFNTFRWNNETKPDCCEVVPILYDGSFKSSIVDECISRLSANGSIASSKLGFEFAKPEGVVVYHTALKTYMKITCENDEKPKSSR